MNASYDSTVVWSHLQWSGAITLNWGALGGLERAVHVQHLLALILPALHIVTKWHARAIGLFLLSEDVS